MFKADCLYATCTIALTSPLLVPISAPTQPHAQSGDHPTTATAPPRQPQAAVPMDAYMEMMQPMHKMHQDMAASNPPATPDKDFILMMLPHHQAAVDMAKAYLKHGKSKKLRAMAQDIISSQENEI